MDLKNFMMDNTTMKPLPFLVIDLLLALQLVIIVLMPTAYILIVANLS
jgi:hypothetical protein